MTLKQFTSLGGKARAAKLTKEQLTAIGKAGAEARWKKPAKSLQASIAPVTAK